MLHAYVERFDVTDTVGKILGTKRGGPRNFKPKMRSHGATDSDG